MRLDQVVGARALTEPVVDPCVAAQVEEDHAQHRVARVSAPPIHLCLGRGHIGPDALHQPRPLVGHAERLGDRRDLRRDQVRSSLAVHEHHRDPGSLELQLHLERPDAVIGQDHRRIQFEDRLGIQLVAVVGHHRQVGELCQTGRHVATHQVVAQAQREDGGAERAVGVERQDARHVVDGDRLPAGIGDGDGQLWMGPVDHWLQPDLRGGGPGAVARRRGVGTGRAGGLPRTTGAPEDQAQREEQGQGGEQRAADGGRPGGVRCMDGCGHGGLPGSTTP